MPHGPWISPSNIEIINIADSSSGDEDEDIRPRLVRRVRTPVAPPVPSSSESDIESESESDASPRSSLRPTRRPTISLPTSVSDRAESKDFHPSSSDEDILYDAEHDDGTLSSSEDESIGTTDVTDSALPLNLSSRFRRRRAFQKILSRMESPADIRLRYPESLHPEAVYDSNLFQESKILQEFLNASHRFCIEEDTFEKLDCTDFSIYHSLVQSERGYHAAGQFENLFTVSSQKDVSVFLLDGVLHHEGQSRKIMGAIVTDVSIGNLMDHRLHTTADSIWVQTNKSYNYGQCWYQLVAPSRGYSPTWQDSIWLADFNKHVIDVLYDASRNSQRIGLDFFEDDFIQKLGSWHSGDPSFDEWSALHGQTDFRQHLAWHADFLRDQVYRLAEVSDCLEILEHPVWEAIGAGEFKYGQERTSELERTVVTPAVGAAFLQSFAGWGQTGHDLLHVVPMAPEVAAYREHRRLALGFPIKSTGSMSPSVSELMEAAAIASKIASLSARDLVGKVIVTRVSGHDFRFAWVKEPARSGSAVWVVWLATPKETFCGCDDHRTHYPVQNELFLTDEDNREPVFLTNVVAVYSASVPGRQLDEADIIVQLLYQECEEAFTAAKQNDLLFQYQESSSLESYQDPTPSPSRSLRRATDKLRNLDLFSGCGLLGHSLNESGYFETVYAVDHNEAAIRTHAVNNENKLCKYVIGSVNVSLQGHLTGRDALPKIDSVTAGSPCPGYSTINNHKGGFKSQRNNSLVMSAISWIDLFLPEVAILENVGGMYSTPRDDTLANAGAQCICCLVSLGYQVRKMQLFARDYAGPTIRERHFLVATAPTINLPDVPPITCGQQEHLRPWKTVRDAIQGLASIHNDARINIGDPLHVPLLRLGTSVTMATSLRHIVQAIPKLPGSSLVQAFENGRLSPNEVDWFLSQSSEKMKSTSKSLRRINPENPFKTMVTQVSPLCSRMGTIIHPFEDRVISLREMIIAMGVPYHFIFIGSLEEVIKLVGNGVVWQVGLALGNSVGKSLVASNWNRQTWNFDNLETLDRYTNSPSKAAGDVKKKEKFGSIKEEFDAPMSFTSGDQQLQSELIDVAHRAQSLEISELPDGNTIGIQTQHGESSTLGPLDHHVTKAESKTTEGILEDIPNISDTENTSPNRIMSEEVYEISDRESLAMEAEGSFNYQHTRRGKMTRRPSSAAEKTETEEKKAQTAELPSRKKRAASETPPPRYRKSMNEVDEGDSDSDIEFLGSRPVTKKSRFS